MKNKKIVVNGFSDGEKYFTMLASCINGERNFENDWDSALAKVQKKHPDDWQVSDVEKELEKMGWLLKNIETVDVAY